MNTLFIGQIKGAKAGSRKDKATQQMSHHCEVIVQYEDYDKNGELVLDTQTIQLDVSEVQKMKDNVQKFISIPFRFISTPKGNYIFQDEDMTYTLFDKSPLALSAKADK